MTDAVMTSTFNYVTAETTFDAVSVTFSFGEHVVTTGIVLSTFDQTNVTFDSTAYTWDAA